MLKLRTVILTSVATFWATSGFAACVSPVEVKVPDGSQASMDEMLAAQTAVKSYMADMEDYLKCLDDESASQSDTQTEEQKVAHVQQHNSAVDAMERVANSFNEQIRAYKALND
ncbi:MAG: hypothetical protein JSV45_13370 [Chromatiales bacterium]|nr:MAG: hypothetical protein JSV45_13370 [Chromatiales bacterium]